MHPSGTFNTVRKLIRRAVGRVRSRMERAGFTLMETGFALSVAAVMLVTVSATLVDAVRMQREAERLSIAASLCQSKMSQLLSRPDLSAAVESGNFGDKSGPMSGFKYEVRITRENLDLAKIVESGTISTSAIKEEAGIPDGKEEKESGAGGITETGGMMEIMKIVVTIRYPLKESEGIYSVTTFRAPGDSL